LKINAPQCHSDAFLNTNRWSKLFRLCNRRPNLLADRLKLSRCHPITSSEWFAVIFECILIEVKLSSFTTPFKHFFDPKPMLTPMTYATFSFVEKKKSKHSLRIHLDKEIEDRMDSALIACVGCDSCGFRLRNARNAIDCVACVTCVMVRYVRCVRCVRCLKLETGLQTDMCCSISTKFCMMVEEVSAIISPPISFWIPSIV